MSVIVSVVTLVAATHIRHRCLI